MRWPLIRNMPHHFSFDFVKLAPFAAVLSVVLIIASGVSLGVKGLNFGTDFKGGTKIDIVMTRNVPQIDLQRDLARMGAHDPHVQGFKDPHAAQIRFQPVAGADAIAAADAIKAQLAAKYPDMQIGNPDVVGAKVSGELFTKGMLALAAAVGLMLLYIWFRFQLQFGFGAVIAIFHDVILTLGVLSFMRIEFSLVSIPALLTVIGYSMNEKVITFDRLRENLRKYKKTPLRDVINLSENERLSRTLITGTTALLALAGMLFLGGPALFPMILTMVMGIIFGTYSSIYVALPIILLWGVRRNDEEAVPLKPMTPRPGL